MGKQQPTLRAGRAHWFIRTMLSVCLVVVLNLRPAPVQAESEDTPILADEYSVRAALVLNIARFVSGPPERFLPNDEAFHIGVMGPRELIHAFRSVQGKLVSGRKVRVHALTETAPHQHFQLLYNGSGDGLKFESRVAQCSNPHVLTICESASENGRGGMIVISKENEHLALTVFRDRAEHAGLVISSQLLNLSTVVDGGTP